MLNSRDVPLSQSALLVVDAQNSFKVGPRWARRNNPDFERNVTALIAAYRAASLPVIYFLHTDGDPGFERDSVHLQLMDFLHPRPGEPVLLKDTRNAFTSTTLQPKLLALGVRRVVVTGISMEQCCETTARVAADLGYAVDFVLDATMTFPITHPERPGVELGTAAIEERTFFALHGRFARVVRTATLVAEVEALIGEPATVA